MALGMEEAQRQYLDRGITITYEYMAPEGAPAEDQTERLLAAGQKDYDVIGVDVTDEEVISPLLDKMVDSGTKVMTFSSSDAAEGCKRLAYVGNTHNYRDGADLAEALCKWDTGEKSRFSWEAPAHRAMKTGQKARGMSFPNTAIWRLWRSATIWIPSIWPMISRFRF